MLLQQHGWDIHAISASQTGTAGEDPAVTGISGKRRSINRPGPGPRSATFMINLSHAADIK
jgi:hypothetical protein